MTTRTRTRAKAAPSSVPFEAEVVTPRTGAKRTLASVIREIPNYLRLLFGLLTDPDVATVDKLLVAGAIAYVIMPFDLIPDFIPFIGEVDDIFFLVLALQRLIDNSGRRVILAHWRGDPQEVGDMRLAEILSAAAFFLPKRIRRSIRRMATRS